MTHQVTFFILIVAVVFIQAKELDPGPQTFSNSNSSAIQNPHKRFATKEVIVYLTPSQIQALETGKAELRTSPDENTNNPPPNEQRANPQLLYNAHLENLDILKAPVVQDLLNNEQHIQHHGQSYFTPHSYPKHQDELPKLQSFNQDIQSKIPSTIPNVREEAKEQSEWVPIAPVSERQAESYSQEQYHYWQNNEDIHKGGIKPNVLPPPGPQLQYASNYDSQYVSELGNALRQNSKIENFRALAQAEAIDNSPPIVIHKEVQITKHKPVPVYRQVNVPVPTPVLVPILHPYEVKVPQPYPVPIGIIKHVPVPIIQTEKAEVEKLIRYALNNPNAGYNVNVRVNGNPHLQGWK